MLRSQGGALHEATKRHHRTWRQVAYTVTHRRLHFIIPEILTHVVHPHDNGRNNERFESR